MISTLVVFAGFGAVALVAGVVSLILRLMHPDDRDAGSFSGFIAMMVGCPTAFVAVLYFTAYALENAQIG